MKFQWEIRLYILSILLGRPEMLQIFISYSVSISRTICQDLSDLSFGGRKWLIGLKSTFTPKQFNQNIQHSSNAVIALTGVESNLQLMKSV